MRAEILARLPNLAEPYVIEQIALCGERPDGNFELVERFLLGAAAA